VKDAFEYESIASIVDRVFIMAYDQHWSGSEPGPVAGYDWCEKVVSYARTVIPESKLVMGLPFYGRSWQNKVNSRAYRYSAIEEILKRVPSASPVDPDHPSFQYDDSVKVTVFYENDDSLMKKAILYRESGAVGIGFWRIGQESKAFWRLLDSENEKKEKSL
jgi:spore germination protein YaaH